MFKWFFIILGALLLITFITDHSVKKWIKILVLAILGGFVLFFFTARFFASGKTRTLICWGNPMKAEFQGNTKIEKVLFVGKPEVISEYAFSGCTNLKSVTIPDTVREISKYAFEGCVNLEQIVLPELKIEQYAFSDCTSLHTVILADSMKGISETAFKGCTGLELITTSDSITEIKDGAYKECWGLDRFRIPASVTRIGDEAFYGCSFAEIAIPDSVTEIGNKAFYICRSLAEITIPDSVTKIGDGAFHGCSSLTEIAIPDSVTEIGIGAFSRCTSLAEITIPRSASIGSGAFTETAFAEYAGKLIPDTYDNAIDIRTEPEKMPDIRHLKIIPINRNGGFDGEMYSLMPEDIRTYDGREAEASLFVRYWSELRKDYIGIAYNQYTDTYLCFPDGELYLLSEIGDAPPISGRGILAGDIATAEEIWEKISKYF